MQPENTRAPIGPEQVPVPATEGSERAIPVLPSPEAGIESGAERVEQRAEASAAASDAAATGAPIITSTTTQAATDPQAGTANPLVAADDDVIEKEWVDKAKKIITETKDDPHQRTARVNDLQKDYLQKRYGKVLGASE